MKLTSAKLIINSRTSKHYEKVFDLCDLGLNSVTGGGRRNFACSARGVPSIFKGGGASHCVTPRVVTRWSCRHPRCV